MKIIDEVSLTNFDAWGSAVQTVEALTFAELDQLEAILEDAYPDGMSAVELNDFLSFETDTIADWLGYSSADVMLGLESDETEEDSEDI